MRFPRPSASMLRIRPACEKKKYTYLNDRGVRFVLAVSMIGFGFVACGVGLVVVYLLWPWLVQMPMSRVWALGIVGILTYMGLRIGRWSGRLVIRDVLAELLRIQAEQRQDGT